MRKWLIIATILVILGGLTVVMTACSLNLDSTFKSKTAEIKESFDRVEINIDTALVTVRRSDGESCRLVSDGNKKITYSSSIDEGTLKISQVDQRKWYEKIFYFGKTSLDVYLPRTEYDALIISGATGKVTVTDAISLGNVDITLSTGDLQLENILSDELKVKATTGNVDIKSLSLVGTLSVTTTTGDVHISQAQCYDFLIDASTADVKLENVTCGGNASVKVSTGDVIADKFELGGDLNVKVSTGRVSLSGTRCKNLISEGNTGDITLTDVIADGKFDIIRTTGDVAFDNADAAEISVKTDTGSVNGTLLTDKVYLVSTDTGKIDVPKTTVGGKCEITTTTGNIKITVD